MTDIVERLHALASEAEDKLVGNADVPLRDAADEIERLRTALHALNETANKYALEIESLRSMLTDIVSVWDDDSTDIIMNTVIREAKETLGDD